MKISKSSPFLRTARSTLAALAVLAALAAFGALTPRHAGAQVSVGFFYDNLDPYGEWVRDPDYGYVWHPTGVDDHWAPYTDGYWAYTDSGWTWVSYEDYGGIVYHYGRWAHIPDEGWVWVPGYTWAPAWVSWRSNDDYIGWAPLPPEARWNAEIGFGGGIDAHFDIGPGFYSFVGVRDFGAPALGAVILGRDRNVDIINTTTNITNITVNNSNVYVGGPNYARIAAVSSRPIPTLKLVRQRDASAIASQGGKILSRQQGNQLMVLAPKVTDSPGAAPSHVAKTLTAAKADHGWDVVKDPQQREKLQARIKSQAGPTGAKAVSASDVKLVDEKIKTKGVAEDATPKPGKGKNKTTSTADLLNAPATDTGASASETPKSLKKSKKAKTPGDNEYGAGAGETPSSKKSKSKKARTPSEDEGGVSDSETPAKHSKKSSDSDLQPFMGSGDSSEPKPKKSYEDSGEPKSRVSESRSYEAERPAGEAKTPKSEKGDKKEKKGKDDDSYPPAQ